jgi:hypothetical protein
VSQSVQDTPSVTTAVGTLATVPKTPGSGNFRGFFVYEMG